MKSGITVEQTAAACGEAQYIAYGVAAPAMAAALGLQLVLDWNSGNPGPRLRTVRVEKKSYSRSQGQEPAAVGSLSGLRWLAVNARESNTLFFSTECVVSSTE